MRALPLLTILILAACGSVSSDPDAPVGDDVDAAMDDGSTTDVPTTCTPSTTTCTGQLLTVCDAQGNPTNTVCDFGCTGSGNRCNDLNPSNNLATYLDMAATATPLVLTGNATIDTTARTVTNGDGSAIVVANAVVTGGPVEIMAISVKSLSVGNVTVRGSRALAFLVDEDVTVAGTLNLSADFFVPGPGSVAGTNACVGGRGASSGSAHSGGGGGGFGTAGGAGGAAASTVGGAGGMVSGDVSIVPLRGGCSGGLYSGNAGTPPDGTNPGAGGGAIQISARGSVSLQPGAFIASNGGGAKGYTGSANIVCLLNGLCNAGCGGGSGGAILIEASSISVDATAGLVANGGSGHFGLRGMAANGSLSETPAPGTVPQSGPRGGDGAAGSISAQPGGSSTGSGWVEGAGGGGGGGRIRINLPSGSSFDPGPPVVSPTPTVGAVSLR